MGWKWSVVLAQNVHDRIMTETLPTAEALSVGVPLAPLSDEPVKTLAYLDDGCVMGLEAGQLDAHQALLSAAWTEAGFALHPDKMNDALDRFEKLGLDIDGQKGSSAASP